MKPSKEKNSLVQPPVERLTFPTAQEQGAEYLLRRDLRTQAEKEALSIVQALQAAGFEAYFVGGYVRDVFNGRDPHDIDIATNAPPETVAKMFGTGGLKGKNFGVNILERDGQQFEIVTFRTESDYQDGRRPKKVSLNADIYEDAKRRDFTINAMYFDPISQRVIDFFGGLADLQQKRLRFVGKPQQVLYDQAAVARERIVEEDYLRILRAVRFAARFKLEIDPAAWQVMRQYVDLLRHKPPETIQAELNKMFQDNSRAHTLELLDKLGALEIIMPEVAAMKGVEQPVEFHAEGDVFVHTQKSFAALERVFIEENNNQPDLQVIWATLLHDVGKPGTFTHQPGDRIRFNKHEKLGQEIAADLLRRLRFSKEFNHDVQWLVGHHMFARNFRVMRPAKKKRLALNPLMPKLLMVMKADYYGSQPLEMDSFTEVKKIYQLVRQRGIEEERRKVAEILTGREIMDTLQLASGPLIGLLKAVVQEAYLSELISDKSAALALVRKIKPQAEKLLAETGRQVRKHKAWREQAIIDLLQLK